MRSPADGTYDVSDSDRFSPLQLSRLGQAAAGAKSITTGVLVLDERREKRREDSSAKACHLPARRCLSALRTSQVVARDSRLSFCLRAGCGYKTEQAERLIGQAESLGEGRGFDSHQEDWPSSTRFFLSSPAAGRIKVGSLSTTSGQRYQGLFTSLLHDRFCPAVAHDAAGLSDGETTHQSVLPVAHCLHRPSPSPSPDHLCRHPSAANHMSSATGRPQPILQRPLRY